MQMSDKKKRVILFHPRGSFTHHPVHVPPVGLEYLAAYISDIADVMIVDLWTSHKQPGYYLEHFKPDIIGITSMSCEINHTFQLAKMAKKLGCKVVVGGYHASTRPDHTLLCPFVDIAVRKEGELTFREIVSGKPLKDIKGVSYRDGDKIFHNEDRPWIKNVNDMPLPAKNYRLFPYRYSVAAFGAEIVDTIYSSRGCNFKCDFCVAPYHQGSWRPRSPENIIKEIKESIQLFNTNHFFFVDEDFFFGADRVREFCHRVISLSLDLTFCAEGRVELFVRHPDLVTTLKKAGFNTINIGVESGDNRELKAMKKGITRESIIEAVNIMKKNNINVMGTIMIGFPDEREEQILNKIRFANEINIDSIHYAFVNAYKGTPFYIKCKESNLFLSTDWSGDSHDYQMLKCRHISPSRLKELRCFGMISFYTPRRLTGLRNNYRSNLARQISVPFHINIFQTLSDLKLLYGNGKAYYLEEVERFIPDFFKYLDQANKEEKAAAIWEKPKSWIKIFWPKAVKFYLNNEIIGAYVFPDAGHSIQHGFHNQQDLANQEIPAIKINIDKLNRLLSVIYHVLPRYVKGRLHLLKLLWQIFICYHSSATQYFTLEEKGERKIEENYA